MSTARLTALFISGDPTLRISTGSTILFISAPLSIASFASQGVTGCSWINTDGQFFTSGVANLTFVTDDRSPSFPGSTQVLPVATWVAETAAHGEAVSVFSPDLYYGFVIDGGADLALAADAVANTKSRSAAKATLSFIAEYNKDVRLRAGGRAVLKWASSSTKESRFSIRGIAAFVPYSASFHGATLYSSGSAGVDFIGAGVIPGKVSATSSTTALPYGEAVVQSDAAWQGVAEFYAALSYEIQPVKMKAFNTLFVFSAPMETVIRA